MDVGNLVRLTDPPENARTQLLDLEWLQKIRAAVKDEIGGITQVRMEDGQQLLSILFPVDYQGEFHGIPAAMVTLIPLPEVQEPPATTPETSGT